VIRFYVTLAVLVAATFILACLALWFQVPWLCVMIIICFVFLLGLGYQKVQSAARETQERLFMFLTRNEEELKDKGIIANAGPFGAYIEFCVLS
jgi:uncharacterized membrane protein YdbT with pleckstrin-like domain